MGLESPFGFDQEEERLLTCCLPRTPADQCCEHNQEVTRLSGLDEMRWTVAEMKDEVSQERRRNVLWWKAMVRLPAAAPPGPVSSCSQKY